MGTLNPAPAHASVGAISPQLTAFCPEPDEWPLRWRVEDADVPFSHALVEAFTLFLLAVLESNLSPRTRARRRDHLWMLGGELVRRLVDEPRLRQWSAIAVMRNCLDDQGEPLTGWPRAIYPYITETQQRSFDATCRKLGCFLGEALDTK